jgi:flagellar motility protein MotE (MotC chaperone)
MDHDSADALWQRHPAWRLLRAQSAPLILSFLGAHFVEENRGATPQSSLASALDDHLFSINLDRDDPRYARSPEVYLGEWVEAGWLRRFYPSGSDQVHYDALPSLERAYAWVVGLAVRSFVGTESRLHTVVELLRQIVHGTESDPEARLSELRRRREIIDREIAEVSAGTVVLLGGTAIRDRYQQFGATARELLSDFREVAENFRSLDRGAREQIAAWDGSKGDLLDELVGSRSDINSSDQGRSFQAFYDFLLSESRQDELSDLLAKVERIEQIDSDRRLHTIHHDWSEAAERTQAAVRQISEQLRRFLDDQVWLENRRVVDLARQIEAAALACRDVPPKHLHLSIDRPGVSMSLPFERPLYDARPDAHVSSLLDPLADSAVDVTTLFDQKFVDQGRLADNIRAVVPRRSAALLTDIITLYPVQHGAAEIVGYLALTDDDIDITIDEGAEIFIDYADGDLIRRARLPKVLVSRR